MLVAEACGTGTLGTCSGPGVGFSAGWRGRPGKGRETVLGPERASSGRSGQDSGGQAPGLWPEDMALLWGGPGLRGPLCRELRVRGLPVSSSQTPVACSTDHELVVPPPHPHPQAPGPESCQGAELGGSLALLPGDSAGVRGLQGEYLGGFSPSAHVDPALGAPHAPCPSPCAQVTAAFPAWPSGMNMCLFPGELERWVYRGSPYTAAEVRGPVHTWPGEVAAGLSAHRLAQLVLVGP